MRKLTYGGVWGMCLAAALLLIGVFLASCQVSGATHSVVLETPFYLDGPQQARPADGTLPSGARVTLVSAAGSYAQVVLPDGRRAYVAADSLKPLR
jgi:hypothetical protein